MNRNVKGFTLVEVALATSVGIVILGGTVGLYSAARDSACSSSARERVNKASALIAEYAASNNGAYPTSVATGNGGAFSTMWASKYPDDFNVSPWGGGTGNSTTGVSEFAPITGTSQPGLAPDQSSIASVDQSRAANLMYVQVQSNNYVKLAQLSNPTSYTARGYAISIYDRTGTPWFHLAYGK